MSKIELIQGDCLEKMKEMLSPHPFYEPEIDKERIKLCEEMSQNNKIFSDNLKKDKIEYNVSNLKNGILDCIKDIENNIDIICNRLASKCHSGSIEIIIKPGDIIRYVEKHDHIPTTFIAMVNRKYD